MILKVIYKTMPVSMSKNVFLSWLKGSKYNNIISAYKNVLFTFSELTSKSSFCNK